MEINIFNESGTITAKRICHEAKQVAPNCATRVRSKVSVMAENREKTRGRPGRKPAENAAASSVQVLDRSLKLLELVAEADGAVLTDLADRSAMAPSTVHRLLTSLAQHGMVAHDDETGAWTIGVKAFEIGTAYLRFRKLGTISRPFLKRLMEESGETANIAIEEDGDVVFISQAESHAPMRAFFRPGRRGPIHASGIGKAILSTWADSQIEALLAGRSLQHFTDKTRDTLPKLLTDMAEIRSRGWSIDDEEHTLGMRCVAAPIFDEYGEAVAGISISGPAVRLPDDKVAALGPVVRAAAGELTKAMGGKSKRA
ncbi:transcriptional regulator, IclR family [Rhizobium multihospitium]|uniref:Transcriptional regulator, IclR family n=2 Tax=Rhizobium multihospitium TaxID=410764 RepID=A0A1C3VYM9_9HYPH|nr:transcriptional regulator, IclR family [Rhizobium multihospitium]